MLIAQQLRGRRDFSSLEQNASQKRLTAVPDTLRIKVPNLPVRSPTGDKVSSANEIRIISTITTTTIQLGNLVSSQRLLTNYLRQKTGTHFATGLGSSFFA